MFKNHGASAGASLSHSHSQLLGLPFIPPTVSARLDSMKEHFNRTGKCCLCEIWTEELLISESSHFLSVVPFAASYPFEIWVVPREHSSYFHEIDSEKVTFFPSFWKWNEATLGAVWYVLLALFFRNNENMFV